MKNKPKVIHIQNILRKEFNNLHTPVALIGVAVCPCCNDIHLVVYDERDFEWRQILKAVDYNKEGLESYLKSLAEMLDKQIQIQWRYDDEVEK